VLAHLLACWATREKRALRGMGGGPTSGSVSAPTRTPASLLSCDEGIEPDTFFHTMDRVDRGGIGLGRVQQTRGVLRRLARAVLHLRAFLCPSHGRCALSRLRVVGAFHPPHSPYSSISPEQQ